MEEYTKRPNRGPKSYPDRFAPYKSPSGTSANRRPGGIEDMFPSPMEPSTFWKRRDRNNGEHQRELYLDQYGEIVPDGFDSHASRRTQARDSRSHPHGMFRQEKGGGLIPRLGAQKTWGQPDRRRAGRPEVVAGEDWEDPESWNRRGTLEEARRRDKMAHQTMTIKNAEIARLKGELVVLREGEATHKEKQKDVNLEQELEQVKGELKDAKEQLGVAVKDKEKATRIMEQTEATLKLAKDGKRAANFKTGGLEISLREEQKARKAAEERLAELQALYDKGKVLYDGAMEALDAAMEVGKRAEEIRKQM